MAATLAALVLTGSKGEKPMLARNALTRSSSETVCWQSNLSYRRSDSGHAIRATAVLLGRLNIGQLGFPGVK